MTLKTLPKADVANRPAGGSHVSVTALERWNPDLKMVSETEGGISILEQIGEDWMGGGVTSKRIAAALRAIGERDIVVTINSPGGDFFEGLAIYNLLREHPAKVTVKIVGMAASAASVIAMAADEVQIARAGFLMIHNTWVMAVGDRVALREVADWLEPFDAAAADIYAARTDLEAGDIAAMLDRETWISGAEAVEQGFADGLLPSDEYTSDPAQSADGRGLKALKKADLAMAKAGLTVADRRALLAELKSMGTPSAAPTGMPSAAETADLADLLNLVKSL